MLEEFELAFSSAPLRSYELMQKRAVPPEQKTRIIEGIKAKQKTMNLAVLSQTDAREQFDRWGSCIVSSYRSRLGPEKMGELQRYVASGVYRLFPAISKVVGDWLFIAMKRQTGEETPLFTNASSEALGKNKEQSERLTRLLGAYFVITNSFGNLLQVQAIWGYKGYQAVLGELTFMSADLPKIAASTGVSGQQWSEIENYGASDLASDEDKLYRECLGNESYLTVPMRAWVTGMGQSMKDYFEENPLLLSR
ncbi:MAG: hypothetical protein ACT6Q9_00530 [Polaromonas sp.]|uniref:hypothetical protein n=1 Tax=Polaromonas sp. TaxID=1869339 RepID=UPI004036126A